jgi:hypothetical protein
MDGWVEGLTDEDTGASEGILHCIQGKEGPYIFSLSNNNSSKKCNPSLHTAPFNGTRTYNPLTL